jgi:vitamin B12 transporter
MKRLWFLLAAPAVLPAQSGTSLAPVVVTATRVESSVRAPASVSSLDADSLRARGITQVADALRLLPGVSVVTASSFGSQTSLFVRGGQGNYVRVLLDGVPINEPGGAIDLGALSLDNVARIEVVRGPASVLYGADAVTGVVQLISRTGREGRRGALSADYGSYGQRRIAASGATGGERFSLSADASDQASDGILAFNNDSRLQAAGAAVRWSPRPSTEATLSARWQSSAYHYPTESDGSIADHNAATFSRRAVVAMSGRQTFGRGLEAAWTLAASEHRPRADDGPDAPSDTLGFYGFFSRGTVTRRTADLRATWRAGGALVLTVGGEATNDHERSSSRSLSEYGSDAGTFEASRHDRAIYAQAIGSLGRRASYQAGARLDDNSAFGTFRTARVGGAYQVTRTWRMRGAVGSAFRAPSFFENFATGYVRGNPALSPERSHSREFAIERAKGAFTASVTVFQQRFRDLIQYNPLTMSPLAPNYVNVAGADADGVEAEATAALPRGGTVRLTYTYTRTRVTDAGFDSGDGATFVLGQPLVRRPAHVARAEVARRIGARTDVTVGAAYTGAAHDRDYSAWPATPVVLPARTLLDLAVNARLSASGARVPVFVRVRGDNLTGVSYEGIFGFRAPGRSVRAGIAIGRP